MAFRFALDENFPVPVLDALNKFIAEAELIPVSRIDGRLAGLDDPDLLLALQNDPRSRWDGLVTNDGGILHQARSLQVLAEGRLALVLTEAVGHDPIRATGMLLASLPDVCAKIGRHPGGIFKLRPPRAAQESAADAFAEHGVRHGQSPQELRDFLRADLSRDPLGRTRAR